MRKQKKQSNLPLFVLGAGILLIVIAAVFLVLQNNAGSNPAASGTPSLAEIQRVTPGDAWKAQSAGTAVIVDVRSADAFDGEHITGSISIPETDLSARIAELDPNQWIIPYCT